MDIWEKPLISVILPIYNIETYLSKCMESVINQTYDNLEIIMVDDGSTDNSASMCDDFKMVDKRIVVFHKSNGGLSDARNYGIERANGEFITCIDPDDYVDLDYVEYLLCLARKYRTKMSICQHRVVYDNGAIKENGSKGDENISTENCLQRMLYHDVIDTSAWAKLYYRNLFVTVEYPKGKLFEDIGTTYALMMQCKSIAVGYESKYTYVFHYNSIVNGKFNPRKFDLIEMTDKMAKDVECEYPNLKKAILRRKIYSRFSTLNQMIGNNQYISKRKEIIDFILKNKWAILKDNMAPTRDKLAVLLLWFSYPVYEKCWAFHMEKIMIKGNIYS